MQKKKEHQKTKSEKTSLYGKVKRFFFGTSKRKAVADAPKDASTAEEVPPKKRDTKISPSSSEVIILKDNRKHKDSEDSKPAMPLIQEEQAAPILLLEAPITTEVPLLENKQCLVEVPVPTLENTSVEESAAATDQAVITAIVVCESSKDYPTIEDTPATVSVNGPVLAHENTVSQAVDDSVQSTVESDKQSEECAITEQQSALNSLLFFINEMNEIAMCTDAMSDITYLPALVFFNETRKGNSMPDDIVSSNYAFHSLGKCQPANTTIMDETEANCLISDSL
ncbi:hypothetical protein NEIG_02688, partial [Nematocida sp. ERTm5]